MVCKGKLIPDNDRSSVNLVTHQVRMSVKDRLGPNNPKSVSTKVQSAPVRRHLFSTSQKAHDPYKRGANDPSQTYTRQDRDRGHEDQDMRELIRLRKIQQTNKALKTLRLQQEE